MHLSEEIKQDLLDNFNTLQNFNRNIDFAAKTLPLDEKVLLISIKAYFNSIFLLDVDVESDTINYMAMALEGIQKMKELHLKSDLFIYHFISERMTKNVLRVEKIKLLA